MKYAQDYGLKKVLEDIESFRKNNSDMWPKCNYLEELVKNNKTFNQEVEMNEAVIVSTARTPIGKAYKGAFNNTHGATLAGHAVKKAIEISGVEIY